MVFLSRASNQVEGNDEFGRGVVRQKRIQNVLKDYSWNLCGTATCFVIIAVVLFALLLVLAALDVVPDVAEAWKSATALVLGIPGVLALFQLLSQVENASAPLPDAKDGGGI